MTSDKLLSGFDYLAGFQAARADSNASGATAGHGANGLQVWVEAAVSSVVGVTDSMTELWPLAADFTAFSH